MNFVKKIIVNNCGVNQKLMLNSLVFSPSFSLIMLCTFDCSAESRFCVIPIIDLVLQFFVLSKLAVLPLQKFLFYAVLLKDRGQPHCDKKVILQNTIDNSPEMYMEILADLLIRSIRSIRSIGSIGSIAYCNYHRNNRAAAKSYEIIRSIQTDNQCVLIVNLYDYQHVLMVNIVDNQPC